MSLFKSCRLVIVSIFLFSSIGLCQKAVQHNQRDQGLFLRFLAAPSYSTQDFDNVSTNMKVKGSAGTFRFQIGSAIGKDLIAYGEIGGTTIQNPDIELGDMTETTQNTEASLFDLGAGLTYYFMPQNFYLTGSVLLSQYELDYTVGTTKYKAKTDHGLGLLVGAGKEWWVSKDWSLGVTAFYNYANLPDKGSSSVTIGSTTYGLAFSATFE